MATSLIAGALISWMITPYQYREFLPRRINSYRWYSDLLMNGLTITLLFYMVVKLVWTYHVGTTLVKRIPNFQNDAFSIFWISVSAPSLILLIYLIYTSTTFRPIVEYQPLPMRLENSVSEFFIPFLLVVWLVCVVVRFKHLINVFRSLPRLGTILPLTSAKIFALLFFWPVGIWVLQPKVRAFYLGSRKNTTIDHLVE